MRDDLSKYNHRKLDEDSPWGYPYGTYQGIIALKEEVNEYRNTDKTGVRNSNTKTNTCNGNNKK